MHTLRKLALAAILLAPAPALAFSFGVGLEGGIAATETPITGTFGLILEERLTLPIIELTLWEDVETPFGYQDAASSYLPIDVGLRVGLDIWRLKPYVGLLVNDSIDVSGKVACNVAGVCPQPASNLVGVGGDLGLDLTVLFLRFGIELRGIETLSPVYPGGADVLVLQGLLSARASF